MKEDFYVIDRESSFFYKFGGAVKIINHILFSFIFIIIFYITNGNGLFAGTDVELKNNVSAIVTFSDDDAEELFALLEAYPSSPKYDIVVKEILSPDRRLELSCASFIFDWKECRLAIDGFKRTGDTTVVTVTDNDESGEIYASLANIIEGETGEKLEAVARKLFETFPDEESDKFPHYSILKKGDNRIKVFKEDTVTIKCSETWHSTSRENRFFYECEFWIKW